MPKVITAETPCFHIDVRWVAKNYFEKYGEESKRTHFSCVSWYVDGSKEEAEESLNNYLNRMKDYAVIIRADCLPVTGYFLKLHREPARKRLLLVDDEY